MRVTAVSRWLLVGLLALAVGCGSDEGPGGGSGAPDAGTPDQPDARPIPDDILDYLRSLDGMTVEEVEVDSEVYRFFLLEYEQPVDHDDPDGATFTQRLSLLHRDRDAPMVLYTSGYYGSTRASRTELTRMLEGNQIRTEQRYFLPSRPDPADWSKLTIEQAAGDHHRIVQALEPYYAKGAWLATGASKGGMTSVYHRRFHPDDLDGVVAYVAPLSYGENDPRYVDFLAQVGTEECRTALTGLQRAILGRKEAMATRLQSAADRDGLSFSKTGIDGAIEGSVVELPFAFWQYFGSRLCDQIPDDTADDGTLYEWLATVAQVELGSDQGIAQYETYYYQAFTQLGYPGNDTTAIDDLLEVGEIDPANFVPAGVDLTFDETAMPDVADWVASDGSELMFIYGENDPWTAGAFTLGDATDSHIFVVPDGTHGASIEDLPAADRDQAVSVLERWTGVTPMFRARAPHEPAELRRPVLRLGR